MDFGEKMDKKIMGEDRADDFFSEFPLLTFFHDDAMLDEHFKGWSDDIGFDVVIFVVILVEFFDKFRIDDFEKCLWVKIADGKIKMWINFLEEFDRIAMKFIITGHDLPDAGGEGAEGMDEGLVSEGGQQVLILSVDEVGLEDGEVDDCS